VSIKKCFLVNREIKSTVPTPSMREFFLVNTKTVDRTSRIQENGEYKTTFHSILLLNSQNAETVDETFRKMAIYDGTYHSK